MLLAGVTVTPLPETINSIAIAILRTTTVAMIGGGSRGGMTILEIIMITIIGAPAAVVAATVAATLAVTGAVMTD